MRTRGGRWGSGPLMYVTRLRLEGILPLPDPSENLRRLKLRFRENRLVFRVRVVLRARYPPFPLRRVNLVIFLFHLRRRTIVLLLAIHLVI